MRRSFVIEAREGQLFAFAFLERETTRSSIFVFVESTRRLVLFVFCAFFFWRETPSVAVFCADRDSMRFDAQDDKTPIERALAKGGDVRDAMMCGLGARGDLAMLKKAIEGGGDPKALDEVRTRVRRQRGFLGSVRRPPPRLVSVLFLVDFRSILASNSRGRECADPPS